MILVDIYYIDYIHSQWKIEVEKPL